MCFSYCLMFAFDERSHTKQAREEKVPSSGESSPVRPTLAQSIVFGRSGVEETNNWATFQRPSFRVAHTFVLKPRMSQQEVDAVKAVCKIISQPPDPTAVSY